MKQSILKFAFGTMLVATALSASAASLTAWITGGPLSPYVSVNTDFGALPVDNAAAVQAPMSTFTNGIATYSGGNLYNTTTAGIVNTSARPVGSTGNWWSIQSGMTGTVSFSGPGVAYYGFLWGSPDVTPWNNVSFYDTNNNLLGSYGQQSFNPPLTNNSWTTTGYLNVMTMFNSPLISKITFTANANAFETDNHAYSVSAVPLPAAAWLFGSALLGLGGLRRKQKAAANSETMAA